MIKLEEIDLKECSPYNASEFLDGLNRLLNHPALPKMIQALFHSPSSEKPFEKTLDEFVKMAQEIKTVEIFQKKIISEAIASILNKTSDGLTMSGVENLVLNQKYLFISNHRDIICDSALLTNSLLLQGFTTPKICLGDNLLVNSLIVDLVKMNKGITVKRNLPIRELLKWSIVLSTLIRQQIETNTDSVWIAQREGRAKDGNDLTHPGVIKMLTMSGDGSLQERIQKLHIVPVAISYEYDPCDIFKAKELYYKSVTGSYQKSPHEDLTSMMSGIHGYKGRIHIEIGTELNQVLQDFPSKETESKSNESKKDQLSAVCEAIDKQIFRSFKNWPTHYIAYDLLTHQTNSKAHYSANYSDSEKTKFIDRMESRLHQLSLGKVETQGIREFFLKSYANSILNALNHTQ